MNQQKLRLLPPKTDFQTIRIFKRLTLASRALAELKGESRTIPNENILINTLGLQEAKDSSAIENIITTQDDMYRADADDTFDNIAAKEVKNYSLALKNGFELVRAHRLLTNNYILDIQKMIEPNKPGFRKIPGTVLQNNAGETIYTPPQDANEIINLMSNLEKYINEEAMHEVDPLIKMAIIHYQFESIHPFYDGNGRTGRIINILYLVQQGLLDIPVLYLSKYIIENKSEYYKLLQDVRNSDDWEKWIVWILEGVELTSIQTIDLIKKIHSLMNRFEQKIKTRFPKMYSKDLLENLFRHPYTKIKFIQQDMNISKPTAIRYLNNLIDIGLLRKEIKGNSNFYVNDELLQLFIKNQG
ncbi:MAG: Fic family protein [Calditrichales bacterium]|nr:Fic family protein [Calditrichales bacterium]